MGVGERQPVHEVGVDLEVVAAVVEEGVLLNTRGNHHAVKALRVQGGGGAFLQRGEVLGVEAGGGGLCVHAGIVRSKLDRFSAAHLWR